MRGSFARILYLSHCLSSLYDLYAYISLPSLFVVHYYYYKLYQDCFVIVIVIINYFFSSKQAPHIHYVKN